MLVKQYQYLKFTSIVIIIFNFNLALLFLGEIITVLDFIDIKIFSQNRLSVLRKTNINLPLSLMHFSLINK